MGRQQVCPLARQSFSIIVPYPPPTPPSLGQKKLGAGGKRRIFKSVEAPPTKKQKTVEVPPTKKQKTETDEEEKEDIESVKKVDGDDSSNKDNINDDSNSKINDNSDGDGDDKSGSGSGKISTVNTDNEEDDYCHNPTCTTPSVVKTKGPQRLVACKTCKGLNHYGCSTVRKGTTYCNKKCYKRVK